MKAIPLTRDKVALIDDEDFELVSQYKWYAGLKRGGKWYAQRFVGRKVVYLHRFLLGISNRIVFVDHKNGDGLDCQRHNMRAATPVAKSIQSGIRLFKY